jgi:hypothetical protein
LARLIWRDRTASCCAPQYDPIKPAAGWSDDRAAFDAVVTMMAAGLSPRQIAHEFFVAMKWIR